VSAISFTVDAVLTAARDKTGLPGVGIDEVVPALERWLQAQRDEASLSEAGRQVAFRQATEHVATRIVLEDHFNRHPEISEQRIEAPLFVVGLYRSGTTKLHHLLCADDRWTYLRTWEVMYPAPLDDITHGAADSRRKLAQQRLDRLAMSSPGVFDAHPMSIEEPEEDFLLMAQTFLVPNIGQRTPSYNRWLEQQDARTMYRFLYRQFQLLQWQQRLTDPRPRRLCLKAPVHLEFLEELIDVFTDARVVLTHRDPAKSVASNCLMMEAYHQKYTDDVDLFALGDEVLRKSVRALDNSLRARESLPPGTFFDVTFSDIVKRPMTLIPDVYEYAGMSLTAEADTALRAASAEGDRHKSASAHRYDATRYGLSEDGIHLATARYLEWAATTLGADLRQSGQKSATRGS
jgi:hypothetical protein